MRFRDFRTGNILYKGIKTLAVPAGPGCAVFKCHLVALGTGWEIQHQGIFGVSVVRWARLRVWWGHLACPVLQPESNSRRLWKGTVTAKCLVLIMGRQ